MSMVEQLREGIKDAMRSKNEDKKNIYRVVLGEVESLAVIPNQAGKPVTDEQIQKICRTILASNNETIAVETSEERIAKLRRENFVLEAMVPKLLTQDEIREKIHAIIEDLRSAKSGGQATGIVIRMLKEAQEPVDGNDVKAVVASIRGEVL